jgi:uncharacterized protein (UPF0218 family)
VIQIHLLTEDLRVRLKSPLGILLKGSFTQTISEFEKMAQAKKPSMIIAVGDALSEVLLKDGILPKVLVIDYKVMRNPTLPFETAGYETAKLTNAAGTISDEAWSVMKSAVERTGRVKIIVDGEEDLLALPAILSAPEKAFVVYGQPREGMVVVEVTLVKKAEIRKIVDAMRYVASKS